MLRLASPINPGVLRTSREIETVRSVFLDPDENGLGCIGVIVLHPTGVTYQHQCAGVETDLRSAEGFFVPLSVLSVDPEGPLITPDALTAPFHEGKGCVWGGASVPGLPADRLDAFRDLVSNIPWWTAGGETRTPLELDESRLSELVEGWAPVATADGPGVLVWSNCD